MTKSNSWRARENDFGLDSLCPTGPAILLCIMGYLIELDPLPNALIHWPQPASAASAVSPELNDDLEPIGITKPMPSPRRIREPQPRIEKETPLVPAAVAAAVCEEASLWLDTPLPREWRGVLARRANAIYVRNRSSGGMFADGTRVGATGFGHSHVTGWRV